VEHIVAALDAESGDGKPGVVHGGQRHSIGSTFAPVESACGEEDCGTAGPRKTEPLAESFLHCLWQIKKLDQTGKPDGVLIRLSSSPASPKPSPSHYGISRRRRRP
jgi:hypothetical protein